MFVGHYAVAFACKRLSPRTSLGTFALGAQFPDLLFPVLLLTGVEHVRIAPGITRVTPIDFYDYPISHSLMMTIVWALLLSGIYWILRCDTRATVLLGLAVVSHWVLDFVSHPPDMPLTLHGPLIAFLCKIRFASVRSAPLLPTPPAAPASPPTRCTRR